MESCKSKSTWNFGGQNGLKQRDDTVTVRSTVDTLMQKINKDDKRTVLPLGHGDPSGFPYFRTTLDAEQGVIDALCSVKFNSYGPFGGLIGARRATAEFLSRDLPYKLSPEDVFLTVGCSQAIEIIMTALSRPGANILLPRPGYSFYHARATFSSLEVRYFDLLPENGWEVDLAGIEDGGLADTNTVAIVIINPGNPCGNVFSYQHLKKVAETARKLGMLVISDEVYVHMVFGSTTFVPMGTFGSIAPVVTLGSISKRWMVPGWRIGWIVINDTNGILANYGIVQLISDHLNITTDPATFMQGALPHILEKTTDVFFSTINSRLKETAEICFEMIKDIHCITFPNKPQGSMFAMVKLEISLLDGIDDDMDFCMKVAEEESVIILPGSTIGMKNWLRITYAVEPPSLEDALTRLKAFCQRYAAAKPYLSCYLLAARDSV